MEMKVKSDLVVQYRKERAWSQQHLSEVCGVSLRTIQRVENSGNSSFETVKALASCLEIELEFLIQKEKPKPLRNNGLNFKKAIGLSSLMLGICGSLVLTSTTTAASDIEVLSRQITSSKDTKINVYSGDVSIFIPQNLNFTIASTNNENTPNPQYKFKFI